MSHFCVFVFSDGHQSINDLLEPYNEELEVFSTIPFDEVQSHFLNHADELSIKHYNKLISHENKMEYLSNWFGYKIHDNHYFSSTYNPLSKWDWFEIGGRWDNELQSTHGPCNECQVGELLKPVKLPFAFVTDDGTWFEQGEMGWFGMDSSTEESIKAMKHSFEKYLKSVPDHYHVTLVDCHI